MKNGKTWLAAPAATLLLAFAPLAAFAAGTTIARGVDTFTTVANGKTYYSFADNPIPAGFFCKRSAPFTGRIAFKGLPLATETAGQLRGADTVIERLDDAVFDEAGQATTRVRFKALSLVSLEPLKTGCGAYHVYVSLAGRQRETTMRIERTSEKGGAFSVPLAVDARMTFVPVRAPRGKAASKLELTGRFTFPATSAPWSHQPLAGATKRIGSARIDTDGNQIPDSLIFGTANFAPGWSPDALPLKGSCSVCEPEYCHLDPDTQEEHCTGPIIYCYPRHCP